MPLRSAGGDLGFLATDAAKADVAIGPCWPSRDRVTIHLRRCNADRACDEYQQRGTCNSGCGNKRDASKGSHFVLGIGKSIFDRES